MQVNNLLTNEVTLEAYLKANGITNIDHYLNPPTSVLDKPWLYDNMREAVDEIKYCILNDLSFGIIQDNDTDGVCSAYILYKYIKLQNPKCKVKIFIPEGKVRGLDSEDIRNKIIKYNPSLLIIPDAGTNSRQYEDELYDNNIPILVLDHHNQNENVCQRAIIVNNTMNQFECNRELSGTGVTFKVLQALDMELNTKYSNHFIDLVGLSIISDCMDVRTYENRWFINYFLNPDNIENDFISKLLEMTTQNNYNQRDISFKIVPLFNSIIRCGTLEDKQKLFMAFMGKNIDEVIELGDKYHKEQVNRVNKFISHHQSEINEQADSNITVIEAKDVPQTFSGLIAGKISGMTNKPCIVGKNINDELCGSFRGYIPIDIMRQMPHITLVAGHETGAYGIHLDTSKSQNLADFRAEIDKMDISIIPDVIASYSANKLQMGLFKEFARYDDLWGQELKKPTFYIYNIRVNSQNIMVFGKKNYTLKIAFHHYEIMFFNMSEAKKEIFQLDKDINLNINIIGSVGINNFRGKKTNQIIVEDFEVEIVTNTFDDLM